METFEAWVVVQAVISVRSAISCEVPDFTFVCDWWRYAQNVAYRFGLLGSAGSFDSSRSVANDMAGFPNYDRCTPFRV